MGCWRRVICRLWSSNSRQTSPEWQIFHFSSCTGVDYTGTITSTTTFYGMSWHTRGRTGASSVLAYAVLCTWYGTVLGACNFSVYWFRAGWLSNGVLRGDPAHGGRSGWMLVVNWMVVYLLLRKRVFCCGATPPEVNEKLANRKRNGGVEVPQQLRKD